MRKLKGSGNYLKNQVRENLAKSVVFLLLFVLVFGAVSLRMILVLRLSVLEIAGLLVSLASLAAFYYYLRRYRIFSGGLNGEKQVIKLLSSVLSDDYFLLNDLYLRGGDGDIYHVVLAPNGIFVLETKNWSGNISCNGDEWQRAGRQSFKGSPSRQVKRNVATIKRIIDSSSALSQLGIWVEGIVVFTNNHATFHLINPTVLIVKLSQLLSSITTREYSHSYSREQLEAISKEILKQKR
jgi:hypothetical protein